MTTPFYCTATPDWTRSDLQQFEQCLNKFYLKDENIDRIADNAGIDRGSIKSGTPKERMRSLLNLAFSTGKVRELIKAVLSDPDVAAIHPQVRELTGTAEGSVIPPACPSRVRLDEDDDAPPWWRAHLGLLLVGGLLLLGGGVAVAWVVLLPEACEFTIETRSAQGTALEGVEVACREDGAASDLAVGATNASGLFVVSLPGGGRPGPPALVCGFSREGLKGKEERLSPACPVAQVTVELAAEVPAETEQPVSGACTVSGSLGLPPGTEMDLSQVGIHCAGFPEVHAQADGRFALSRAGDLETPIALDCGLAANDKRFLPLSADGVDCGATLDVHELIPLEPEGNTGPIRTAVTCYINRDGGSRTYPARCVEERSGGGHWCKSSLKAIVGCDVVRECVIRASCLD